MMTWNGILRLSLIVLSVKAAHLKRILLSTIETRDRQITKDEFKTAVIRELSADWGIAR